MSYNKASRKSNTELDLPTIKQILTVQHQQVTLEAQRLKIGEKRIEADANLAEKSMELNAKLMMAGPGHKQKQFITTSIMMIIIMILFLGFIGWLVWAGKEEFVMKFLNWLVHLVFGVVGFWVGRITNKNKPDHQASQLSAIEDAEMIK
ncbi:MAG: hypothetical protein WCF67_03850 [Chitinophagaceae bacterium]